MPDRTCSIPDCAGKHLALGYCTKHYQRWNRFGDPHADHSRKRGTCTVPGCGRTTEAKGYCGKHYQRFVKYGDPMVDNTRVHVDTPCTIDGCQKVSVARGLCGGHYTRQQNGKPLDVPLRRYLITDDLAERLRFYAPPGDPDQCWEWTGSTNKGYGLVATHGSRMRIAHDVAWELHHNRSLPAGMVIRHTCDNPLCVNPAHLLLGTHADNSDDKVSRDRQAKGSGHGLAKLTEADIPEIRAMCAGGWTQREVAARFGVSQANISAIITGKTWAYIK